MLRPSQRAGALAITLILMAPVTLIARESQMKPLVSRDMTQVIVTLEQRVPSCFGCLEYRVELQAPRTVRFQCLSGCALPGRQEMSIDEADFVAVVRALDDARFLELPRRVGDCIDCPYVTVTYRDNLRIHEVIDAGGSAAPDGLRALQRRLVALTNPFDMYKEPTAAHYKALVTAGWSPNERLNFDETMLNPAVRGGDADAVRFLIDRGARINHRALDEAAEGTPKVLDVIWNATKTTQASPQAVRWLVRAAAGGHEDIVSWLIGRGVAVDALDSDSGLTALLGAAAFGASTTVEQLLAKGANPALKDPSGSNALWHAAETDGTPSVVSILLKRGLPVDGANLEGRTPLMHAAESCAPGNVRLLLEAGADARLKDRNARTAFDLIPPGHGAKVSQCQATKALLGR